MDNMPEGEIEFRNIADSLPTLCWIADKTGFIIWYNNRWHEYCGTTEETMRGWGWTSVHDPEVLPSVMEKWQHSIATGEPFEQTFPLRGHDGIFRSFMTRVVPIKRDGEVVRWLGINIDVSEQLRIESELRESEERLRALNQTLEMRVEERAVALKKTEEQLRQSQKMEAVGQLTGGLAHDFNNLLTGIMGNLELMQMRIQQKRFDDLDRFVSSARTAGNRATALTQRLLAFSRRQTLAPKPTHILDLINDMEEMLQRTIGPEITLQIEPKIHDGIVLIDAPQLENALLNLCINSRDAMPNGGSILIDIGDYLVDNIQANLFDIAPGAYIRIKVIDNGCGMDETTISKAFDPFFTTKPIGQGTGLGLSMIYGFSRQSKGHVAIESMVGAGTTITIYLPKLDVETSRETGTGSTISLLPACRGNILLVDDEETIRYLLIEVLEEAGYRVMAASDGSEALRVLEANVPLDLLITDVGLPNGMNGRQVADAARSLRPDIKILFITGYAEQAVLADDSFSEGTELLTKPFGLNEIVERTARFFD